MLKKINHIAILVEELERAIERFKGFGMACTEVTENEKLGIRMAFLPIGESMIELLQPTGSSRDDGDDGLARLVRERKGPIDHICFEVDDLEASIEDFKKNGAKLVEGCPRPRAHGHIAFFYPETTGGVLIELCEV